MSIPHIVVLVFEAFLGVFCAYAAYSLFARTPPAAAKMREALGYPGWYWVLAGIMATIGAIGLFAGLGIPAVGVAAALWMVAYFVVATLTHLARKDTVNAGIPLIFLVPYAGLAALLWTNLTPLLTLLGL